MRAYMGVVAAAGIFLSGCLTGAPGASRGVIYAKSKVAPALVHVRPVKEIFRRGERREVSVIGRPDREWGEIVVAYIVSTNGSDIDAVALDDFCKSEMARFKRPRHYHQIEALPKNNYGKVLKTELRKLDQEN